MHLYVWMDSFVTKCSVGFNYGKYFFQIVRLLAGCPLQLQITQASKSISANASVYGVESSENQLISRIGMLQADRKVHIDRKFNSMIYVL